jgi:sn-glycerol 3-phosphate transport system substrate-binding protein
MRGRRWTFILLAAALGVAACGGGGGGGGDGDGGGGGDAAALPPCPVDALDEADGPVDVVVWHALVAKTEETLNALADRYNQSQDRVRVHIESQGTAYEELVRKYTQSIPTNDLPALVLLDDTQTQFMADSGTVLPAQSCIDAEDYDTSDWLDTVTAYYSIDGVLWPGSMNPANAVIYYNRGHFRQAGLDPDDPPDDFAELRDAAIAIRDAEIRAPDGRLVERPFVWTASPFQVEFWLTGSGTPIVDHDNGRDGQATEAVIGDEETTLELYSWLDEMNRDGLMEPISNVEGGIDHYLALANQTSSMTVESSTAATSVEAFLAGDLDLSDLGGEPPDVPEGELDIGAGPYPGIEEPGRIQMGGGAYYMTNTVSEAEQAGAWDFLKFVNSTESQVTWVEEGSYLPLTSAAADDPALQQDWEDTLSGQWLALAYDQQVEGIDPDFPGPLVGPYTELRTALRTSIEDMLFDGLSPEEAVAQADADLTEAIEEYREENF